MGVGLSNALFSRQNSPRHFMGQAYCLTHDRLRDKLALPYFSV